MFELYEISTGVVRHFSEAWCNVWGKARSCIRRLVEQKCGIGLQNTGSHEHLPSPVAHGSTAGVWHFRLVTEGRLASQDASPPRCSRLGWSYVC
jgi:hypothetical protein